MRAVHRHRRDEPARLSRPCASLARFRTHRALPFLHVNGGRGSTSHVRRVHSPRLAGEECSLCVSRMARLSRVARSGPNWPGSGGGREEGAVSQPCCSLAGHSTIA